jgi:1-acyl-sn-glycerol-3-phosphate acyltransferase
VVKEIAQQGDAPQSTAGAEPRITSFTKRSVVIKMIRGNRDLEEATQAPFLIRRPFESLLKGFVQRVCGLTTEGAHLVPPGPIVVCANHRSHFDSVVIMSGLNLAFKDCALLAARDYFFADWRICCATTSVFSLIAVDRQPTASAFKRTSLACEKFLQGGGRAIVAYPEGGRGVHTGVRPFKRGPCALALYLDAPIVPAFVDGTQHVLPKGRKLARPSPITVRFGSPIYPDATLPEAPFSMRVSQMTADLFEAVRRLERPDCGGNGEVCK